MQMIPTLLVLTYEHQSVAWTIALISVATQGAGFARIVCIDFYDKRGTRQGSLIHDDTMQFSKCPLRCVTIGSALFGCEGKDLHALFLAFATFGALSNACQVF